MLVLVLMKWTGCQADDNKLAWELALASTRKGQAQPNLHPKCRWWMQVAGATGIEGLLQLVTPCRSNRHAKILSPPLLALHPDI